MDILERERAISSLIKIINADTLAIETALATVATHEESRAQAIYRLVHLADARFVLSPTESFDRVLSEFLLLEVHRIGKTGSPVAHLQEAVRARYGDIFAPHQVRQCLYALRDRGELAERGHYWFAPSAFREQLSEEAPFDMKGKIVQILKAHPQGLQIKSIMREVESRYKITGNNKTISHDFPWRPTGK